MLTYLGKIPHPSNFTFTAAASDFAITSLGGDVHRIQIRDRGEWRNPSQAVLATAIPGDSAHTVTCAPDGTLAIADTKHKIALAGVRGATFGRCGDAWLLQFKNSAGTEFYGLGEHTRGLEKSGQRVKFWNTDVIADFSWEEVVRGHPNPQYVAIPWLIVKRGNFFVGLLVHHPGQVFMELGSNFVYDRHNRSDLERRSFYLGAPNGNPDLYVIVGPSLAALTRKYQTLVGRTPLPPLWSLGYQQCRWGYAGPKDLNLLDREMTKRRIPCDGLWLDIDYMERLKVFTFAKKHWGNVAATRRTLAKLAKHGRRVVPILDPGVKVEPGYHAYEEGLARDLFCQNPGGTPYVGFVWPGQTHFPDFSLPETRAWWAQHVAGFARLGVGAAWIDMNDPATGAAEVEDMRFNRGREPHENYHNQYALGMAEATRAGFLAARPEERPFVISRSACTTSGRFAAVWTGDNLSNWHHLQLAIPVTLGLALSGIPFCGPDVCGFGLDATRELAIAWHKLQFLFPFFRNHSATGVREQEPWKFGRSAEKILTHYIRLRYKFLPYLYQLFIAQEQTGEAILRPLFYDFPDRPSLPLGKLTDQFMVGPSLLQAPIVAENATTRTLALPGGTSWFSLRDGRWTIGGKTTRARATESETPLFVRDATLLPLRPGLPETQAHDLRELELHVFLAPGSRAEAALTYSADDGLGFGYQRGARTTVIFRARRDAAGALTLRAETTAAGFGPLKVRVVTYSSDRAMQLGAARGAPARKLPLKPHRWQATGRPLTAHISAPFEI